MSHMHVFDTYCSSTNLECPAGTSISSVAFASFGEPLGDCATNSLRANPSCHSTESAQAIEELCKGKATCSVFVDAAVLGTPGPACGSTGDVSVAVRHQCAPTS